ncbi:MAG: T9SS type A sorting domain-containing protein [Candidatus Electryonea clarkiae]|nr:T9SS type A sorting domain-containing protein [Candidatus Electryonea clarkiae]MDP8286058.1 T9SS type A sorting domain-containing protein [Candidatus Electryonea clarkiae]
MYGLKKYTGALLVVSFLALITPVYAQDSLGMHLVDGHQFYAGFYDIALTDDYALVAAGTSGLLVLSDYTTDPEVVAQVGDGIEYVWMVNVLDNRAFTVGDYITYYDFSYPTNPEMIWRIADTLLLNDDPYISHRWIENRIIVLDQGFMLTIYEVTDESQMEELSVINVEQDDDTDLVHCSFQVWRDYLITICYLRDLSRYAFRVWDISDPENPEYIVMPEFDDEFYGDYYEIAIENETLAFVDGNDIRFFDISDIEQTELLSTITIPNRHVFRDVFLNNGSVFVGNGGSRGVIISISLEDINNPVISDSLNFESSFSWNFDKYNNLLSFVSSLGGLSIFDISDPDNLNEHNSYNPIVSLGPGAVLDEFILSESPVDVHDYSRIAAIAFSDSSELSFSGFLESPVEDNNIARVVTANSDIAVIEWSDDGESRDFETLTTAYQLVTIDPEDRTGISQRGFLPSLRRSLTIHGNEVVYESTSDSLNNNSFLKIWDITDLDAPYLAAILDIDGDIFSLPMVYDDFLYIVHYDTNETYLEIFDLEDPFSPESVGNLDLTGIPRSNPVIFDDRLFFSNRYMYSLENPSEPELLGELILPESNILDYEDNKVITRTIDRENTIIDILKVYDISEMEEPELIGQYPMPGRFKMACFHNDRIVSTWSYGYGLFALGENGTDEERISILPLDSFIDVYPNPGNPGSVISVNLAKSGLLTLELYDLLGRRITRLSNSSYLAGNHRFNISNMMLQSSGTYFLTARSGNQVETRKIILLK